MEDPSLLDIEETYFNAARQKSYDILSEKEGKI